MREFCEIAFAQAGMPLEWTGEGTAEFGTDMSTGNVVVRVDERYFRPTEVDALMGNPAKAKKMLGWEPTYTFQELVSEMVQHDIDYFTMKKKEASAKGTFRMETLNNDK